MGGADDKEEGSSVLLQILVAPVAVTRFSFEMTLSESIRRRTLFATVESVHAMMFKDGIVYK